MPDSGQVPLCPSRLEPWSEAASFCVPWLAALATALPRSRMADDLPLLRSLGHVPIGFEGLVSMGLGACLDFLPLGSRSLRVSWVSAFGLGLLGWLLYRVTLACQRHEAGATDPRFPPALALATALTAALGPLLSEGSVPGGASVAAALALASVLVAVGIFGTGAERPLKLGLLLGATLLESRVAFGAALAVLVVCSSVNAYLQRGAWSQAAWLAALGGILALCTLPVALLLLAVAWPAFALEIALAFGAGTSSSPGVEGSSALRAWSEATGLLWCGISLLGFGLGLLRAPLRPWLLALGVFLGLDALLAELSGRRFAGALGVLSLLGIPALAVGGALGVTIVARWLREGRIAFSRPVRTLLVVYAFTLAFVSAEASSRAAATREASATDAVTDELWRSLPPRAVLMLRSEPLLFRLLTSRINHGSRPDVVLLSMPHFEHGGSQARHLAYDPALVPLVRDMLLNARPSEFALSELADRHALYLEPDLRWDSRLFGHVSPRPFFGEFASHPLGRSDRKTGLEQARDTDARVLALVRDAEGDAATRALVASAFRDRAAMLAALGDRELARLALTDLLSLVPEDELGLRLKSKLDEPGRGPVALGALAER